MSDSSAFSRLHRSFFATTFAIAVITGGGTLADIAAGTVAAASAQNQPAGPPPGGPPPAGPAGGGHRMGKILMSLNLSDAQKSQIRTIMADTRKQNENVTDRDARRANMKAAYEKIDTVLTPEQRTELHAKLDAMHQQNAPAHAQ